MQDVHQTMAPHCAVVNPHIEKILLTAQVYLCVCHMGHPALPHCTSSRGAGICGDSPPLRLNRAKRDIPEHLGPVPPMRSRQRDTAMIS